MKFIVSFLALASAAASRLPATRAVPARPLAPAKVEAPLPSAATALALRGGGAFGVTKELFVKTISIANMGFGLQFFLTPKTFWQLNFDSIATDEMAFISRIAGIAIIGGQLAFMMGDAEQLYPVAMASALLIAIFGPLRAEMTLPCKPAHKLPVVLLPSLLLMGIAAGI